MSGRPSVRPWVPFRWRVNEIMSNTQGNVFDSVDIFLLRFVRVDG